MQADNHRRLVSAAFDTARNLLAPRRRYGSEQTALAAFLRRKRLSGYSVESRERILREAIVKADSAIQFFSKCREEFDYPFDYVRIESEGALSRLAKILGTPSDEMSDALNQHVTEWVIGKLQMNWIDTPDDFRRCCKAHFAFLVSDYRMHMASASELKGLDPDTYEFMNDFAARYINDSHRVDIEGRHYGHGVYILWGACGGHNQLDYLEDEATVREPRENLDSESQYEILKKKAALLAERLPRLLESNDITNR